MTTPQPILFPPLHTGSHHPWAGWLRAWRYLLLMSALLTLLVVQPIAARLGLMESVFDALLSCLMVILAIALAQDAIWRTVACVLCIPVVILLMGAPFLTNSAQVVSVTAGHAIGAVFFMAVAGKIVQSIFSSRIITLDSIFGAICGYLLLGVAWALVYAMIYSANPASFELSDTIRQQMATEDFRRNIFIYYSFVTLTTVGYGDLTPLSEAARTVSWVEAMTGQLYLAILIAGLISALVASNTDRIRRGEDP